MSERIDILVACGYGARTKQPLVNVTVQSADWSTQMSPETARDLAHNLLEAAEAAVNDAFLIEFMQDKIGIEDRGVAGLIEEYRQWRKEHQR